jgi:hypothetical protein
MYNQINWRNKMFLKLNWHKTAIDMISVIARSVVLQCRDQKGLRSA